MVVLLREDIPLSSGVDVLVVTGVNPGMVIVELWNSGADAPFEIHVVGR